MKVETALVMTLKAEIIVEEIIWSATESHPQYHPKHIVPDPRWDYQVLPLKGHVRTTGGY